MDIDLPNQKKHLRYIDLFAGCGGLSEGFEAAGMFRGVAHVEWESAPLQTLISRLRDKWRYKDAASRVIQMDIRNSDSLFNGDSEQTFPKHLGLDKLVGPTMSIDVLIGGPPCQAYSMAGRIRDKNGMQRDYRNFLFESYLRVVARYRPALCVFENVPGMLSAKPGGIQILDRIRTGFRAIGYEVPEDFSSCLVQMSEFGLPQNRSRVILLAVRSDLVKGDGTEFLKTFYSEVLPNQRSLKARTVVDTIGKLPPLLPRKKPDTTNGRRLSHFLGSALINDHIPRFHSLRDQAIFRELAIDAQRSSPRYRSVDALRKLYTERTGRNSAVHKYSVLQANGKSNLIPAHLHKDGLRHIHFDAKQARSITVREAALLQGFPMDFEFCGAQGHRYKMIGNAVPPIFAMCLANAVAFAMETLQNQPILMKHAKAIPHVQKGQRR